MPRRKLKVGISSSGGHEPIVISERDWKRIESGYGTPLETGLRDRIQKVTQGFALSAIFEGRASPLVDAREAVNEFASAGKALRNLLMDESTVGSGRFYAAHLIGNYLRDTRLGDYLGSPGTLAALASVLASFVTACEQSLAELSETNREEGAAWDLWVQQLSSFFKAAGLPTAARKDSDKQKNSSPSPFVVLIRELQKCVPRACYRQRSDSTLATAISAARARANKADLVVG